MSFKKVIVLAAAMLLAAVTGSWAQPFPNSSSIVPSIYLNHSGVLKNYTGSVKRMTVVYTVKGSSGVVSTRVIDSSGSDVATIFRSDSGNFWQLADTVVFSASDSVNFPSAQLSIDGFLIPNANHRNASGSAAFIYTSPPGTVPMGVQQLLIQGSAQVTVQTMNRAGTKIAVKATNFQPSIMSVFVNNTAVSYGTARLNLPAMSKKFTGMSTVLP